MLKSYSDQQLVILQFAFQCSEHCMNLEQIPYNLHFRLDMGALHYILVEVNGEEVLGGI